jgi:hypothetical protein
MPSIFLSIILKFVEMQLFHRILDTDWEVEESEFDSQ